MCFSIFQKYDEGRNDDRMKHGELRKALLAVFLLSIILVVYLYWQQNTTNLPRIVQSSPGTSYPRRYPPLHFIAAGRVA